MLRDNVTCDFTHPRAYLRNKWITLSHPFSCVGYKTVIAVDTSPRSLFIIVECVLQAYTVCRYVSQNDVTSSRWQSGLTRHIGRITLLAYFGGSIWIVYYTAVYVPSETGSRSSEQARTNEWTAYFRPAPYVLIEAICSFVSIQRSLTRSLLRAISLAKLSRDSVAR